MTSWRLSVPLAIAGLALATGLVGYYGVGLVAREVVSVGVGGFAIVCAWQMVLFLGLGLAWGALLPSDPGRPAWVTIWGRMVRDSAGNLLPFSQIGGFVAGARAVVLRGIPWPVAAASTAADVAAEFLAELVLIFVGLVILIARYPHSALVWPVAGGLALSLPAAAGFFWAQRGGNVLFGRIAERILGSFGVEAGRQIGDVREAFAAIYTDRGRVAACFLLHVLNWFGTGVAAWITFHLLGSRIDLLGALAIDGLLHGALSAAVVVPGNAGVQEAAYVALGTLFGQPPAMSLAVSLIRRARDLALGVPILLGWQWQEVQARRERAAVFAGE